MPQGMTARGLVDACLANGIAHRLLQSGFPNVMAPFDAGARINRAPFRRENILPAPLTVRMDILAFQRIRQINRCETFLQVLLVNRPDTFQLPLKWRNQLLGQHRESILGTFAVAYDQFPAGEFQILDA